MLFQEEQAPPKFSISTTGQIALKSSISTTGQTTLRSSISYTEDKVVLNFHGEIFFCLTPPLCKTNCTPCYPPKVIVASRFVSVIYNCACDPLLILFVYVIKIKHALQNIMVAKV
jgi:hypothetical protein